MALDQSALLELVESMRSADSGDLMRRLLAANLQELIEAEATEAVGAGRYERSPVGTVRRDGSRPKTVSTTAGDVDVRTCRSPRSSPARPGIWPPTSRVHPARARGSPLWARNCTRMTRWCPCRA
jgi:putative transposase